MLAKVLNIEKDTIYLEVESQIRFSTRFALAKPLPRVARYDNIEFEFAGKSSDRKVVIKDIWH